MDDTILYLTAFVCLISVAVATSIIAVRRDGRYVGDLIKQFVIWAGIASLLPLTSWAGATLIHPRHQYNELTRERGRLQQDRYATNDEKVDEQIRIKERERIHKEEERLDKLIDEEQRLFNRARFWVGFPIGLIAMGIGFFLSSVAVGSGLSFGGLCTLTSGCYSYWDDIDDVLRFVSLLAVLLILIGIGLYKYRRPAGSATAAP